MTETPAPCGKCGQVHVDAQGRVSCKRHISGGAHPDRKGEPCKGSPMRGQEVCSAHGGRAPQAKTAGERRLARERILELAVTLGEPVDDVDPGDLVAEQIAHRAGHVRWLRKRVQAIDPDALVWGVTRKKRGGHDYGVTKEARPNIWLELYFEASAALERLCLDAIRAGLEERRVRLAERQAEVLEQLLDGILRDLGQDPDDPHVAGTVARHLHAVGE
jgi:hypothetical protein